MSDDNSIQLTQRDVATHLDMSERNLRDVLRTLDLDWKDKPTQDRIRVLYIRHLRSTAAGRGGDRQEELADARTEEARVKAALGRLDYQQRLGLIVSAEDAERTLIDWAGLANREFASGTEKLILEIEHTLDVSIDRAMVEESVRTTTEGIKRHAEKLSGALVEGLGDLHF
ncbi:MAG: hypothetical protein KZQ94_10340 [Candidatus Thiodiazotropha sp. (ex Troendleina suluensis)]|nr:hypothetical protein [Candidatus Thiodiazotropha sp. (ex Troendleina suluensis)]